jgi:nucleotidyltransferase substrate binding protein (TIGR01987 family)
MAQQTDIRWPHRLQNFHDAFCELDEAVHLSNERGLSKLEALGLVHVFECTYELAWKVVKDFYQHQGESDIQGSRHTIQIGFEKGLIEDGNAWFEMIKSRTLTSNAYKPETARLIADQIVTIYHPHLRAVLSKLDLLRDGG